jgi:hypothetical protein
VKASFENELGIHECLKRRGLLYFIQNPQVFYLNMQWFLIFCYRHCRTQPFFKPFVYFMSYNYNSNIFLLYERGRGIKASLREFILCIKPWIYWVIQNDCGMNGNYVRKLCGNCVGGIYLVDICMTIFKIGRL